MIRKNCAYIKNFVAIATLVCLFVLFFGAFASTSTDKKTVSVNGKQQEGQYAIDAYGVWYLCEGKDLIALGCADPLRKELYVREEIDSPNAQIVGGNVRLVWPQVEGAASYTISRTSSGQTDVLGTLTSASSPPEFYDFSANMKSQYEYHITAYDLQFKELDKYAVKVSIPDGAKAIAPNSMSLRIWGISYKNDTLAVHYNIPKGAKENIRSVSVSTKSGRILFGTLPSNYQIVSSFGKVEIKFNKPLVRGDYMALIEFDVWRGGTLNNCRINPYATPVLRVDFSTK